MSTIVLSEGFSVQNNAFKVQFAHDNNSYTSTAFLAFLTTELQIIDIRHNVNVQRI